MCVPVDTIGHANPMLESPARLQTFRTVLINVAEHRILSLASIFLARDENEGCGRGTSTTSRASCAVTVGKRHNRGTESGAWTRNACGAVLRGPETIGYRERTNDGLD